MRRQILRYLNRKLGIDADPTGRIQSLNERIAALESQLKEARIRASTTAIASLKTRDLPANSTAAFERARHELEFAHSMVHDFRMMFAYEDMLENWYSRLIVPGDGVVDIGAHAGRHLERFISLAGPTGFALAFEPLPEMASILNEKFGALANVKVENKALADFAGSTDFVRARNRLEESGLRQRIYNPGLAVETETITVPVARLDDYVDAVPRCAFVKIDVEGGEILILKGAATFLARWRPFVAAEYGHPGYSVYGYESTKLFDVATDLGYVIYDIFGNAYPGRDQFAFAVDFISWDWILVPKEQTANLGARVPWA